MALCLFRNLLPWIALVGFGYFSILLLTCLVLIMSTVYLTFSKQKPLPVEKLEKEETIVEKKEAQGDYSMNNIDDYLADKLSESLPEMEGVSSNLAISSENQSVEDSSTSEDDQDNVNQSSACSDGSISDEDSLIEIDLPNGHYVCYNEEETKFNLHQKMPDFMAKSIFHQQHNSLMELLAEINEENLIEIDISMGSIKCSRFEIEA